VQEDAVAEQVETYAAVHLPHDPFGAGVDAFGPSAVVREGEADVDGCTVEFETVHKGVEAGQPGRADANHPSGDLLVAARGRREELCEPANESGQFGHLRAGFGELGEETRVHVPEAVGMRKAGDGPANAGW
jgi:hypothetical protein